LLEKVSIAEKLALISEHWRPKVVAELNGQEVKLVKFQGTFVWHHHENLRGLLRRQGRRVASGGSGPPSSRGEGHGRDAAPPDKTGCR